MHIAFQFGLLFPSSGRTMKLQAWYSNSNGGRFKQHTDTFLFRWRWFHCPHMKGKGSQNGKATAFKVSNDGSTRMTISFEVPRLCGIQWCHLVVTPENVPMVKKSAWKSVDLQSVYAERTKTLFNQERTAADQGKVWQDQKSKFVRLRHQKVIVDTIFFSFLRGGQRIM